MSEQITWPRATYRLTEEAYMPRVPGAGDEMLPVGTEIIFDGKPGGHMEAMDADGQLAKSLAGTSGTGSVHNNSPLEAEDTTSRQVRQVADIIAGALRLVLPEMGAAMMEAAMKAQRSHGLPEQRPVEPTPPPAPPPPAPPPAPAPQVPPPEAVQPAATDEVAPKVASDTSPQRTTEPEKQTPASRPGGKARTTA